MLNFIKKLTVIFLAITLVFFCSCQGTAPQKKTGGKLRVVATFLPVYDAARCVGGDLVEVKLLLPPGASPHTYEPTPRDSISLEEARVIFKLGLGLDDWVDRAVAGGIDKKGKTVAISGGVELLPLPEEEGSGQHHQCTHDHHSHKGCDPHVWMDPMRMKIMAKNVLDHYKKLLPQKAEQLQKNYETYARSLDKLDKKYQDCLNEYKKRDFVTFHPFMNYLSHRYGLRQVAVVTGFAGKEPDPKKLIQVIEKLKEYRVKTVFAEPQFSPRASETIAREIGGRVVIIDPVGSLKDSGRDTYVKNMEQNLKALTKAFEQENSDNGK